jgi:hypothetical protein
MVFLNKYTNRTYNFRERLIARRETRIILNDKLKETPMRLNTRTSIRQKRHIKQRVFKEKKRHKKRVFKEKSDINKWRTRRAHMGP